MPPEPTPPPPPDLPQPITDIPPKSVGKVVQNFINLDGVEFMDVSQQPDGKFTVTPKAEPDAD